MDQRSWLERPFFRFFLALLPLGFFLLKLAEYARQGRLWDALWLCNVCNLLLFPTLLFGLHRFSYILLLCLAVGLPSWLFDFVTLGDFKLSSFFTHVISPLLAAFMIAQSKAPLPSSWLPAFGFFAALQIVTRLFSPPDFNIHVVFDIHPGAKGLFSSFPLYWLSNQALFLAIVIAADHGLRYLHHKRVSRFSPLPRL